MIWIVVFVLIGCLLFFGSLALVAIKRDMDKKDKIQRWKEQSRPRSRRK